MKNKKFKITMALLTGALVFSPVVELINNTAQAREVWREHTDKGFSDPNYHKQTHSWGDLHFFYTDEVARRYAYELYNSANILDSIGIFSKYLDPYIRFAFQPDASRMRSMANSIINAANKSGNGVELAVKYYGGYDVKPR